jgi:hypothetical protein
MGMNKLDPLGPDQLHQGAQCPCVRGRINRANHRHRKNRHPGAAKVLDKVVIAVCLLAVGRAGNSDIVSPSIYGAGKGKNVATNTSRGCFDNM